MKLTKTLYLKLQKVRWLMGVINKHILQRPEFDMVYQDTKKTSDKEAKNTIVIGME